VRDSAQPACVAGANPFDLDLRSWKEQFGRTLWEPQGLGRAE
jgi:hypothetical protein